MADFLTCHEWTMGFEDPEHSYEPVPDVCPAGCTQTRCWALAGINSGEFPVDYQYILSFPLKNRGSYVEAFYRAKFWDSYLEDLASNEIAKRVYDSGVNQGPGNAARFLQRAINEVAQKQMVDVDGVLGTLTVQNANMMDIDGLVVAFKQFRLEGYMADKDWDLYGKGWTIRAEA